MRVRKRLRRMKRMAYLGGVVGTAVALRRAKARRDARIQLGPPGTWPPLQVAEPPVAAVGDLVTAAGPAERAAPVLAPPADLPLISDEPVAAVGAVVAARPVWVEPEDGACPLSHPVKTNGTSRIYHLPGGHFYERTRAERCYADAVTAEADGYRAAKSS